MKGRTPTSPVDAQPAGPRPPAPSGRFEGLGGVLGACRLVLKLLWTRPRVGFAVIHIVWALAPFLLISLIFGRDGKDGRDDDSVEGTVGPSLWEV